MRRKCCVPSCNSADKCTICQVGLSFFKAPRETSLIKKWEIALGLKEQSLLPRDRVCSSHFRKSDVITKRFVSLKRPSTNSKMVLEVSKVERDTVPTVFRHEMKQCTHGRGKKTSSTIKSSRSEGSPVVSATVSSQSDDTDDSSGDDRTREEKRKALRPTRRDYRSVEDSVEHRSRRRQIRAFNILRIKWLEKIKTLEKETGLLEERIHELEIEEVESSDCD